jgi:hypothetical protein
MPTTTDISTRAGRAGKVVLGLGVVVAVLLGILVFARPGMVPAAGLDELMTKVKALDMDDVRKQIAAEDAAQGHDHDHGDGHHHHGHDHDGHDHGGHDHGDHDGHDHPGSDPKTP